MKSPEKIYQNSAFTPSIVILLLVQLILSNSSIKRIQSALKHKKNIRNINPLNRELIKNARPEIAKRLTEDNIRLQVFGNPNRVFPKLTAAILDDFRTLRFNNWVKSKWISSTKRNLIRIMNRQEHTRKGERTYRENCFINLTIYLHLHLHLQLHLTT